jgi:hypothetical protein
MTKRSSIDMATVVIPAPPPMYQVSNVPGVLKETSIRPSKQRRMQVASSLDRHCRKARCTYSVSCGICGHRWWLCTSCKISFTSVGAVNKYLKTRHSDSDAAVAAASTGSSIIQVDDEDVVQMEIDEEDQSIEAGPVEDLPRRQVPSRQISCLFRGRASGTLARH